MTHYTDRSSYEAGMFCPRLLYWTKYHPIPGAPVPGVVPADENEHLAFGKSVHAVVEGVDPYPHLAPLLEGNGAQEWESLFYGLATTYERFIDPVISHEFEWVSKEEELKLDLGRDIVWLTRLDGVLRRRSDGKYFVLEAKTSGYPDLLLDQSTRNFQLLMEIEALRRTLPAGTDVGGAFLLVFNKGQKRRATEKELSEGRDHYRHSPFTYWYVNEDLTSFSLTKIKGHERRAVGTIPNWYEKGLELWPDVFRGQVQFWPSVEFDPERTKDVMAQVTARETWFKAAGSLKKDPEHWMQSAFQQDFSRCKDRFGSPCPAYDLCYRPRVARDPLGSGLYVPRTPNHPEELNK